MAEQNSNSTVDEAGYVSGDSTITMLSTSPSPPPGMDKELPAVPAGNAAQNTPGHRHVRHPSSDSTIILSPASGSPAPSIGRVESFDEFMGRALPRERVSAERETANWDVGNIVHRGVSEASTSSTHTLIMPQTGEWAPDGTGTSTRLLPGGSSSAQPPIGEWAPDGTSRLLPVNPTPTATPQVQVTHENGDVCTQRNEFGQCVCMCVPACYVQENSGLATEIANLFPGATNEELQSIRLKNVLDRYTGNEPHAQQPFAAGGATTQTNQYVDRYSDDRYGVALLLEAHAILEARGISHNSEQALPGVIIESIERDDPPVQPNDVADDTASNTANGMANERANGITSDIEDISDTETERPLPDSDVDMSDGEESDAYVPSSSPSPTSSPL
ncbi:hypothetical protein FQN54_005613 [Arachnomyces sp. PD_36]|nr:hypothetical protein FQN54_005613 [Arachnomyces sp. PD_36]